MSNFVPIDHVAAIARALAATALRGVRVRWGSRPHRHMQAAANASAIAAIWSMLAMMLLCQKW